MYCYDCGTRIPEEAMSEGECAIGGEGHGCIECGDVLKDASSNFCRPCRLDREGLRRWPIEDDAVCNQAKLSGTVTPPAPAGGRMKQKVKLLLTLIAGVLISRGLDWGWAELNRELAPASPAAQKLIESLLSDADWEPWGTSSVYHRRLSLGAIRGTFGATVHRNGEVLPGLSADDCKRINRVIDQARRIAEDRMLAKSIRDMDGASRAPQKVLTKTD